MVSRSVLNHLRLLASSPHHRASTSQLLLSGHHICSEHAGPILGTWATPRYLRKHGQPKGQVEVIGEEQIARLKLGEGRAEGILMAVPIPPSILMAVPIPPSISTATATAISATTATDQPIQSRTLLLHGLADPRNIGSLIRSALALGWSQVILHASADPLCPQAIRCSKGAILAIPQIIITSNLDCISDFQKIYLAEHSTDPRHQLSHTTSPPSSDRILLVLGSESHGLATLPPHIRSLGTPISIQTNPAMPHLGVATAGPILMHHLRSP